MFRTNIRSPFLIFFLLFSFNSVGMWTEIPQINSNGKTVSLTLIELKKKVIAMFIGG